MGGMIMMIACTQAADNSASTALLLQARERGACYFFIEQAEHSLSV